MDCNLLFRWFVGPGVGNAARVPTVFTKNRDRLLITDVSRRDKAAILAPRDVAPLLSDDPVPVDDTPRIYEAFPAEGTNDLGRGRRSGRSARYPPAAGSLA